MATGTITMSVVTEKSEISLNEAFPETENLAYGICYAIATFFSLTGTLQGPATDRNLYLFKKFLDFRTLLDPFIPKFYQSQ